MAENKTQPTTESVDDFIQSVSSTKRRDDSFAMKKIMEEVTGEKAVMWGNAIVGFGNHTYQYESGRKGKSLIAGFSPRKAAISLYLMGGMEQQFAYLLAQLGKYKTGSSCIYITKLSDINEKVLRELIKNTYTFMKLKYPE